MATKKVKTKKRGKYKTETKDYKLQAKVGLTDFNDFVTKAAIYHKDNMSAFIIAACRAYKPLKRAGQ